LSLGARAVGGFSPAALFSAGEQGAWYDPSDFSTMFQDDAGVTPVTSVGQSVGRINDKSGRGNHATQPTAASRPVLGRVPVGGRRNLLTFTEQFDDAAWTKAATSIPVTNGTAPDGTATADTLQADGTSSQHYVNQSGVPNGSAHVFSVYAKAGTASFLNVQITGANLYAQWNVTTGVLVFSGAGTGTLTSTAQTSVGNGWHRLSVAFTQSSGSTQNVRLHVLDASADAPNPVTSSSGNILIWGAQLEVGTTATNYQRVVTALDVTQAGVPDCYYLSFDGTDDFMLTPTITPGTDKAQVFAGVRKLSDAGQGALAAFGDVGSGAGSFELGAPSGAAQPGYSASLRGNAGLGSWTYTTYTAPITNVVASLLDLADVTASGQNKAAARFNGLANAGTWSTGNAGVGNFGAYPLYIGRRNGTALPLNGQLFSLVVRFGANLPAATITQAEAFVNSKTGAY